MTTKGTIVVIASHAETLTLLDGKEEPVGYDLNELAVPVMAALDAGYEMVLATPKAKTDHEMGRHFVRALDRASSKAA